MKLDLIIFRRNDPHIETPCYAQHLVCYLIGQGYSLTLKQNRVRPITSLFEVGLKNHFYRNDPHIETTCYTQHLVCYLTGQGHSMTLKQNLFGPYLSYLKSEFTFYSQKRSTYKDCCVQHLGCYLEGQGHRMTLQQKREVWDSTFWGIIINDGA